MSFRLFKPLVFANFVALSLVVGCHRFLVIQEVNNLKTELPAACILMACVAVGLAAFEGGGWFVVVSFGMVFGLLVLTKASGAYIALLLIPLFSVLLASRKRRFWSVFLSISLGFVFVVSPWVLRNQMVFGRPVIAQGGGDVFLIRSAFNDMSERNYRDAFYVCAPKPIRRNILGSLMNLSEADFACGGSLSAFNRKLPCDRQALLDARYGDVSALYLKGKRAITKQFDLSGEQKKAVALKRIAEQPWSHVRSTLPLGWRGFWPFKPTTWLDLSVNPLAFLSLLLLPLLGLRYRRPVWILIPATAVGFFAFYAGVSHFLPRYSAPLIPVALVCLAMVAVALFQHLVPTTCVALRH